MEKRDTSTENSSLVRRSGHTIARRADSLVRRGLRDIDTGAQAWIRERIGNRTIWYARGFDDLADEECPLSPNPWFWKNGDPFTFFGMGKDGEDCESGVFLIGNDNEQFWNEVGDPAQLTQEKLKSALMNFASRLHPGEKMPGGGPVDLDWVDFIKAHADDFLDTLEARKAWESWRPFCHYKPETGRVWGGEIEPPSEKKGKNLLKD